MNRSLIVISDLHIGAGPLDDCDAELEGHLVDFLNHLASRNDVIELVINGDFLDFAQAPPWQGSELESTGEDGTPLCFTEEQSHEKFLAIKKAHKPIFQALGSFLNAKPDNSLTILPGNHDADLFWNSVRNSLMESIAGHQNFRDRIRIHLEQVYRPREYPEVWIEHGHQYDEVNRFVVNRSPSWSEAKPPIREDIKLKNRLIECVGTRFLVRQINGLDKEYPFIDNIKPFSLFLRLFALSGVSSWNGPLKVLVAAYGMLAYLAKTAVTHPGDFLSQANKDKGCLTDRILNEYRALSKAGRQDLDQQVEKRGFQLKGRPIDYVLKDPADTPRFLVFLAGHLDLLDRIEKPTPSMMGASPGTLSLGPAFLADETAELKAAAKKILVQMKPPACVVMGHTHEVVNDPAYKNIGSWTRQYDLRRHGKLPAWSTLRSQSYNAFPYQLNYLEAVPGAGFLLRTWASSEGGG